MRRIHVLFFALVGYVLWIYFSEPQSRERLPGALAEAIARALGLIGFLVLVKRAYLRVRFGVDEQGAPLSVRHRPVAGRRLVHLNGWQRLGIVLSALWVLFVCGLTAYVYVDKGNKEPFFRRVEPRLPAGGGASAEDDPFADLIPRAPAAPKRKGGGKAAKPWENDPIVGPAPAVEDERRYAGGAKGGGNWWEKDPVVENPEPKAGAARQRKRSDEIDVAPTPSREEWRLDYAVVLGFALLPVTMAWALVYGVYWTVRWVMAGFRGDPRSQYQRSVLEDHDPQ